MLGWLKALFGRPEPAAAPLPPSPEEAALERWRSAGRPAERVAALEALAGVGGPQARAALEAALQDLSSIHTQIAAARLLGETGDPSAAPLLERVASDSFWSESRERRARGHSGMGQGPEAGLRAARRDEDAVKTACRAALSRLKGA